MPAYRTRARRLAVTGLSTTAGASDQNAINATRKPAILKRCRRGELAVDDEAQHHGQHTLRQGRADCHSKEEDNRKNQNAHALFIGGAASKTSPADGDFPEEARRFSGGNPRPDTLPGLDEHSGADQPVDDARSGFRRHLQRILESVDRDERCPSVDDFFENRSDDLGTTGCVAAIQFHKASLPERGW